MTVWLILAQWPSDNPLMWTVAGVFATRAGAEAEIAKMQAMEPPNKPGDYKLEEYVVLKGEDRGDHDQ